MTIDEAIFCMKSYLPDNELTCLDCRHRHDCQSDEAHKMAIEALQSEQKEVKWCGTDMRGERGE